MGRPLLVLAAFCAAGCAAGAAGPGQATLLLGLAALAAALSLRASPWVASASLCAGALAIAAAATAVEKAERAAADLGELARHADDGVYEVVGRAERDGSVFDGRGELRLQVEEVGRGGPRRPWRGGLRVAVGGESPLPAVLEGDLVKVWTTLREPRGYATPGARDSAAEAERDGLGAFGYCKSARLVSVEARTAGLLAQLRAFARGQIERYVPGAPEAGLVRAMVLGDRAGLDRETLDRFRASGTYHVLALSGAQVALVALLLGGLLARLGLSPALRGPLVAAAVCAYAALVGGEAPVVRAAIMASVLLLGRSLELDGDVANLLGLAALLLLLRTPSDVEDPGFQLSFAATLGLVLLTDKLKPFLPPLPLGLDFALASSLAAQLALAPLLVWHFHRLAPAALVLNVVAVPLATAVLVSGAVLCAASSLVPALGPPLGFCAFVLARALLLSGRALELLPGLDVRTPDPLPLLVVLQVAAVAVLAGGRRRLGAALCSVATLALAWGGPTVRGDGTFEASVLDVGQGDAIVLRSPSGRRIVVDAGGSYDDRFDVAERVVLPYLWRDRVREIDRLVVSHAHPDHCGGVPGLLAALRVGAVWEGPAPRDDAGYARLDQELRRSGVPRLAVDRGVSEDWDGVCLEVLGPAGPARPPVRTRNDDSLVLRATFGDVSVLLTGDVEAAGEAALPGQPAAVLKVAHHGSRTSTSAAFLAASRPAVAVISAGRKNPFGHPAREVLDRLREAGVKVFRTDLDGAVRISTDGQGLRVVTTRSARDESIRPFRQLRDSDDVLRSGACPINF
jgi:competence protein ComEC